MNEQRLGRIVQEATEKHLRNVPFDESTVLETWLEVQYQAIAAAVRDAVLVDAQAEVARLRAALSEHWLYQWACDESTHTDTGACSCGRFSTGPQPSIGAMVQRWAEHVGERAALAGGGAG